jgi:sodium/potassium-transporting ATPase subunit alpha
LDRCFLDIRSALADASEGPIAALQSLVQVARLCNGASFVAADADAPIDQRAIKGDATDTAILRFAESFANGNNGVDVTSMIASHDKLFEIPFNSKNKWMLTVVRERKGIDEKIEVGEPCMLVKGAPDVLFPACSSALNADGGIVPFDDYVFKRVSSLQSEWSSQGQRVLALCKKSLDGVKVDINTTSANDIEEMLYSELSDLTLIGLVGIRDPPRDDVKAAIQVIRRAGSDLYIAAILQEAHLYPNLRCRVFMVTGDHQLTGVAIANQVRRLHFQPVCISDIKC